MINVSVSVASCCIHMYVCISIGPTYKLKRSEVERMYSTFIEDLYKDNSLLRK